MRLFIFSIALFISFFTYAQQELSSFTNTGRAGVAQTFTDDYQAANINPANLSFNHDSNTVKFGLAEIGISAYSEALTRGEVSTAIFNVNETLDPSEKFGAALKFISSEISLNLEARILGVSYHNENIGGFSFNVQEKARWRSTFNSTTAEFAFLGYGSTYFDSLRLNNGTTVENTPQNYEQYQDQISEGFSPADTLTLGNIFDGSEIEMMWFREYGLGFGRDILHNDVLHLHAGVNVKFIHGFGYMDIRAENGKLEGVGAFNPVMGLDFGSAAATNPSAIMNGSYQPIGQGFGLDVGINATVKELLRFGVSVTNIGSIKWDGNVYRVLDTQVLDIQSGGMDSYNIFLEANAFGGQDGIFEYEGMEDLTTSLPTTVRAGIGYEIHHMLDIGADVVIPANNVAGNFEKPIYAVGADFIPIRWIKVSAGITFGGNYGDRLIIPMGVIFTTGKKGWEAGVATSDIVTYFRDNVPAVSLALGFLRFKI